MTNAIIKSLFLLKFLKTPPLATKQYIQTYNQKLFLHFSFFFCLFTLNPIINNKLKLCRQHHQSLRSLRLVMRNQLNQLRHNLSNRLRNHKQQLHKSLKSRKLRSLVKRYFIWSVSHYRMGLYEFNLGFGVTNISWF